MRTDGGGESSPALSWNSTLTLTLNHQSAYTHPPYFSKSHYDVIQVGLICTHAGLKKTQVYYYLSDKPKLNEQHSRGYLIL